VPLIVRAVRAGEGAPLRALRLAALAADPGAFGAIHAREAAEPEAWWDAWAARSEAGDEQRTFVAVDEDGEWTGLALVRRAEGESRETAAAPHAQVNAMWVAPAARRRGVGRALVDACTAWATGWGCASLGLNVVVENAGALAAYERAGFVVRGQKTDVRPDRTLDQYVLVLDLTRPRDAGEPGPLGQRSP
jgi:GNAT superfamily N-acetyltransferase